MASERGSVPGGILESAILATLFLAAWNAVFVFVMDAGYRRDPGQTAGLILSALVWYPLLAAVPILVLSPVAVAVARRTRDGEAPGEGAEPAGVATAVTSFLVLIGLPGPSTTGGSGTAAGIDLALALAGSLGAGALVAHLAASSRRAPARAASIRRMTTLLAAGPCTLVTWEIVRDVIGTGGSRFADLLMAFAALAGGLALAWALRGLLFASLAAGRRLAGAMPGAGRRGALLLAAMVGAAATAMLLSGASSPGRARAAVPGRSNVLLLVADTLRADRIGCYGAVRARTPNIDALAARGARVESVTAVGAWTAPTTASILTGLYPSRHGLLTYRDRIADGTTHLASIFRRAGYATAGFSANPILSRRLGFGDGFDAWEENLMETGLRRHARSPLAATLRRTGWLPDPERFLRAGELFDRALDWIDRPREAPFFLYLQIMDAHDPYAPPPPFDSLYGEGASPGFTMKLGTLSDILASRIPAGRAEMDRMVDLYDGAVAYMDDRIGHLMSELDRRGLLEDTLVVFTFDHGEEFLDHGDLEHTRTLYQEIVRGPLVLAGPGIPPGALVPGTVSQVDIAPTLLEGAGLRFEGSFDGRSLWPALTGAGSIEARDVYMSLLYHGFRAPWHAALAMRSGDLKVTGTRFTTPLGERWAWSLHDLSEDPGEARDLSGVLDTRFSALREKLEGWEGKPGQLGEQLHPLDEEVERRLRTLGYVD